ncbi:C6 transcription factor [Histoplasma capsulatum G186AR]|uniref:C6 transcription factor n=1 Tax=Ajellomyces capsulatus TaxID=5037 RepID=A0A8H7YK65_AJECA|nr:C6 transcription factor [Histoplasma capsulatum]QSS75326.1 C6 transcription factor [Histoplasma capsulatum G186AR]
MVAIPHLRLISARSFWHNLSLNNSMERPRARQAHGQSSTYGQACTQCYKAKCRCVRTSVGEDCERCVRLRKTCQPSESVRKRNAHVAEESDTRIARLENKMESLLSAVQSLAGSLEAPRASVNNIQPFQLLNADHILPSTPFSNCTLVNSSSTSLGFSDVSSSSRPSISAATPNPNQLFLSSHYSLSSAPSLYPADERLNFFRSRMLPYFPFIHLSADITCGYLHQNRPFLLQAIHAVTTFSTQERLVQVEELKRLLFTSALLKVQSNIDLLLGLLTYLAWSSDAFLGRADLVSRLMMLAISLVYDLRLFKSSSIDVEVMMSMTQGWAEESPRNLDDETPYGLLERQRAVLACFILSSNVSSHLGRQDAIRWTPQMDEALRVITMDNSCPTDKLFVAQVRLQLLKQKAEYVRQIEETGFARPGSATSPATAPRLLYLKSLRRQMHELKSSFPPDLAQIDILSTHAQYVELYINHLAYSISQSSPPPDTSGRQSDSWILPGFGRLECLWQSVENIKAWLDDFYKIPCSKLPGQPFHFWSQMILTITLLKYLSTLKDPEWDCHAVRNKVHLISTMDHLLQKLALSSKEPELQCDDHLLKYLSKLLARCRVWGETRWNMASQVQDIESSQEDGATTPDTTSHSHSHIPDLGQMSWMQSMDLGDDQWFEDVLGIPTTFY